MRLTPLAFANASLAVNELGIALHTQGMELHAARWQGVEAPASMLEVLDLSFKVPTVRTVRALQLDVQPNLPWAEDHFGERVSGDPLNPPPSAAWWPFNPKSEEFREGEKYTHTYPERMWPKEAGEAPISYDDKIPDPPHEMQGIRYSYGDLNDVVELLRRDPTTRQAFLPIWFPEDTGATHGGRVPCTLGYLFVQRHGYLHMTYYIRSCDYFRHLRDDIYMAQRLLQWVVRRLDTGDEEDLQPLRPGFFTMHIGNLHCWLQERELLPR